MTQIKVTDIRKELTVGELFNVKDEVKELVSAKGSTYQTHVIPMIKVVLAGTVTDNTTPDKLEKNYTYEVFEPRTKFSFKVKAPNKIDVDFGASIYLKNLTGGIAGDRFVWFKAEAVGRVKTDHA